MTSFSLREYLPDADALPPAAPGAGSPVAHRAWDDARERALAAVRAGCGLVVVLGPPGTGKSLLLRELARVLGRSGYGVLLRSRGDVPVEADARAAGDAAAALAPRVALIDEAHRLDGAALDRLGRLGARQIVLAGVPGSGQGFDRLPVRATVVRLAPLPPGEVGAFTAALLARADRGAPPPSEQAVRRLAEHSGGVPRALDVLVGASALLAAAEGAARIEASHVDRVAATRGDAVTPAGPTPDGDDDADGARGHAGADGRTNAPAVEPPPERGRAAPRRAPLGVPLGTVLGAGLCAAGVAGYLGWQSSRAGLDVSRERPMSARADAAPPGPPPAATPTAPVAVRGPAPGRADTAPVPTGPVPTGPVPVTTAASRPPAASGPAAPTAPEPVQATGPGPIAPGSAPGAGAPAAPSPAGRAVPEPAAPAAVEPAVPLAPGPVAPEAPERAALFAPERRGQAPVPPEPGRPAAQPVLAALIPVRTPVQTPDARALPVGAPVQVAIHHPRDDARAAARAAGLARTLREAGMAVGEPVAVSARGKPGVRYFFAEDRDAALAVLEWAGLAAADVQAADARPGILPRPGAIEITLPPG